MSHAPIETVEEDAADLQFPKGELFQNCYGGKIFLYILFVGTKRLGYKTYCFGSNKIGYSLSFFCGG